MRNNQNQNTMKMKIYKYELEIKEKQKITINSDYAILDMQIQNGVPVFWLMVDTESDEINVDIVMFGTGQYLNDNVPEWNYLGTIQKNGFVWHYFIESWSDV
jgi:hypothetical protein